MFDCGPTQYFSNVRNVFFCLFTFLFDYKIYSGGIELLSDWRSVLKDGLCYHTENNIYTSSNPASRLIHLIEALSFKLEVLVLILINGVRWCKLV